MYCELQYQYYCIYSWALFLSGIENIPYYPYHLTDGCSAGHKTQISLIEHYGKMNVRRPIKEDGFYPMHLKYTSEMDNMLYNVSHNYKEFSCNIGIRFKEKYAKISSIFDDYWMEESERINLYDLEYKKSNTEQYTCVIHTS